MHALTFTLLALLTGCPNKVDPVETGETGSLSVDQDGDGYLTPDDCDDSEASVNPGAMEVCDGLDNDCNGDVDDGVLSTWYADNDNDGFGDPLSTVESCDRRTGYVPTPNDCDDTDPGVNPGASESCDLVDNNCDGSVDEGVQSTFYADGDGDGYGDATSALQACEAPVGYVVDATDCDDTTGLVNPDASEVCDERDNDCDEEVDEGVTTTYYSDSDGDFFGDSDRTTQACATPTGYANDPGDCDDGADSIFPGAVELCDGLDQDCDGTVDDGAVDALPWYFDDDDDGHGDPSLMATACTAPTGYTTAGDDCDDGNDGIHPGAEETCNGADDDCDGVTDGADSTDAATWYRDWDEDGFGEADTTTRACSLPSGYVADATDCDDRDSAIHPGATEVCDGDDNDCDGTSDGDTATDRATWYPDTDGDGWGDASTSTLSCTAPPAHVDDATDCDDTVASIHPTATETCNGLDDDCDGATDEEDASDAATWYLDWDKDGFGDYAYQEHGCVAPLGYVDNAADCNDASAVAYPFAEEVCDTLDNNCDGAVDEASATDATTWYRDADADGWGLDTSTVDACNRPTGYAGTGGDCDDGDAGIHPTAMERCNGVDDDCDGSTDGTDAADVTPWYRDGDGDGYGDTGDTVATCTLPSGYAEEGGDCDDGSASAYPGALERCNGVDDDCDAATDESSAVDASTWYQDADGDSYGDPDTSRLACAAPSGFVASGSDCNDARSDAWPGASEVCDGIDNDCDSIADEPGADAVTWYRDGDADGYGTAADSTLSCARPSGYVSNSTDCNDGNAAIYPGATETCDGVDQDCDTSVDEGDAVGAPTWYRDADADGYGNAAVSTTACAVPSGYVANATDCNDSSADARPGAAEVCDDLDNDCDLSVDEADATDAPTWYRDGDADGYGTTAVWVRQCDRPSGYVDLSTDCDDSVSTIHPDASEKCDGLDNDCDGVIDGSDATDASTWYADTDGDGYGVTTSTTRACTQPSGYSSLATDCHDGDETINPGEIDVCGDGVDDNCDGSDKTCSLDSTVSLSTADAMLFGRASSDYSGQSVSTADMNGDGKQDILVGAHGNDTGGSSSGESYVVYGPISITMDLAGADAAFYGEASSDESGKQVKGVGDVDNDGFEDMLIGAWYQDSVSTNAGAAYLIYGPPSEGRTSLASADIQLSGVAANDYAGHALGAAQDVDGDGYSDLLVGAYGNDTGGSAAGAAYLLLGPLTRNLSLSSSNAVFIGEDGSDYAGYSVTYAGDINGDGIGDLAIGARLEDLGGTDGGAVYIVEGDTTGSVDLSAAYAKIYAETASDYLGEAVAGLGDPDGDGYGDLLLGAIYDDDGGSSAGAAYVVSGPFAGIKKVTEVDVAKLIGESASDYAGSEVANAGDVDGDGANDILVGAYGNGRGAGDAGATYLFLWPVAGTVDCSVADAGILGTNSSDYSGYGAAGGDINGDGYSDILVGAYGHSFSSTDNGATYLLYGP